MVRASMLLLAGWVLASSLPAAAQEAQPSPIQPVPEPPVVYVPVPPEQTLYMPGQRPPRQRRYREPYYEGMVIPPGGEIIQRRKIGLMIPGAVMFGISYISVASFYAIANDLDENPPGKLLVPVLGPFLAMDRYTTSSGRFVLGWAGLMQGVGLTLFALGVVPRRYVQYYAGTGTEVQWALTPRANGTELGLDLGLRF